MESEMVLVVAGDEQVAERVVDELSKRSIRSHMVVPGRDDFDRESMFEAAFEGGATGVLLVEPLARGTAEAPRPSPELLRGARAARRAPDVTFFGWVTSRPQDDPELAELRRSGTPFGIMRPAPLLDLAIAPASAPRPGATTLIRRELADALAEAGGLTIDELAAEVATWVEQERVREGRTSQLRSTGRPLEGRLQDLGFKPLPLPGWRVELNALFGMAVVETTEPDGRLVVHRRPLRAVSRPPALGRPAGTPALPGTAASAVPG